MIIRARLARLESKAAKCGLSLTVRAWLGQTLSLAEQRQATIEAARSLPRTDWSSMSRKAREWLEA